MAESRPKRTLGKQESFLLTSLSAKGLTLFTIQDARAVLGAQGINVRKLLYQLNRKGWIKRLERGKYFILPLDAGPEAKWAAHEYIIAASLVAPYYLAYATALYYYGYTDRPLNPIVVATTLRKQPVTVNGTTYRFVRQPAYKFFGFTTIRLLEHDVQMAEREKAIADGFDQPDLAGGVLEAAKGLWFGSNELDWGKLVTYTLRLRNRTAARRLGFWLEKLGLAGEPLLARLRDDKGHSYAKLEPSGPESGKCDARWRLLINIPERQLLEWREH